MGDRDTPCERAGVHLSGTGHSQTDCPTLDDAEFEPMQRRPVHRDGFLTVAEAAEQLRVSKMTVYRLIHAGDLRTVRIGGQFRIRETDWATYLNRGTT